MLALHQNGRRVLITPGIVELGSLQEQENAKLGRHAAQVYGYRAGGHRADAAHQRGILEAGFDSEHLHVFDTRDEAIAWFRTALQEGDTVLFLNDPPDTYV